MIFTGSTFQGKEYEFTDNEIKRAEKLRSEGLYQTRLKSILHRNSDLIARYNFKLDQIKSTMDKILQYDPSIRITYNDIGLLGSATGHGWDSTIPMTLADPDKRIWRIRIELNKGDFKFRNGNTWNDNWGDTFVRDGHLLSDGYNISVEKGTYDVQVNMSDKTYSLERVFEADGE